MQRNSDYAIQPHLISEALERVLASRSFRGSARKRRFLQFIVQEALAGRADRIKAYAIAMDVFDRDPSFDPLVDPVVRIQAGRIRRCLEQYYLAEGAADPVQITVPKGGYAPLFIVKQKAEEADSSAAPDDDLALDAVEGGDDQRPEEHAEMPVAVGTARPGMSIVATAALVLTIALLVIAVWTVVAPQSRSHGEPSIALHGPSLLVPPFANATGNPAQDIFADGFTEDLIGALVRFKTVFVFGAESSIRYRSAPELHKFEPTTDIRYVLKGSLRQVGEETQIDVTLINAKSSQYLWSNSFRRNFAPTAMPAAMADLRRDAAIEVARTLAQPYGVIFMEEVRASLGHAPAALSSYECVLWTRQYLRQLNPNLHSQVRSCLERAIKTDPLYADAWAALAIVTVDEDRLGFNRNEARPEPISTGLQLATHAVSLDPESVFALQALGLAHWLHRDPQLAIAAYEQALALNPNDSDVLADLGRCYSLVGEWERGIPMIREAFARNPTQPSWYRIVIALYHYVHGRYSDALAEATRIGAPESVLSHAALAMIYGQTGRKADAAQEVQEILRIDPNFGEHAIFEFERRNINPTTITSIVDGLRKAGLAIPTREASANER